MQTRNIGIWWEISQGESDWRTRECDVPDARLHERRTSFQWRIVPICAPRSRLSTAEPTYARPIPPMPKRSRLCASQFRIGRNSSPRSPRRQCCPFGAIPAADDDAAVTTRRGARPRRANPPPTMSPIGRHGFAARRRIFPARRAKIPCFQRQGIFRVTHWIVVLFERRRSPKWLVSAPFLQISPLSGNFPEEPGSISTASATTHSGVSGDFPKAGGIGRVGGIEGGRLVSAKWHPRYRPRIRSFVSGLGIPFP